MKDFTKTTKGSAAVTVGQQIVSVSRFQRVAGITPFESVARLAGEIVMMRMEWNPSLERMQYETKILD